MLKFQLKQEESYKRLYFWYTEVDVDKKGIVLKKKAYKQC